MANLINMIIVGIRNRRLAAQRNRAYRDAIRELEAYSDYQLDDLGIARADIAHVVKFGKCGEALAGEQVQPEARPVVDHVPSPDFNPSGCVAAH